MNRRRSEVCSRFFAGIFLLVLLLPVSSSGVVMFERTYGGDSLDQGFCVRQTMDGGYIITGRTRSFGAGGSDVYLIKTDSLGEILWSKTYGGSEDEEGFSVRQTSDGGYIISGYTWSFGEGCEDAYLIKTNSQGDSVWAKTYGGFAGEWGFAVRETPDGGYIIVGSTWTFGTGASRDIWLIKTDSLGDTLWWQTYGGAWDDQGYDIELTLDGCYIITGYSGWDGRMYLVKTNSLGHELFRRAYLAGYGYAVRQTLDGGYIIAGGRYPVEIPWLDLCLVKTNPIGAAEWTKIYGDTLSGYETGRSVDRTSDGAYIIAGYKQTDVWLLKFDTSGDTIWARTYGSGHNNDGYCVQQTLDGGYVIVGASEDSPMGDYDVYLIKTDEEGLVGIEEKENAKAKSRNAELSQNMPNPFQGSTEISYLLPATAEVTLAVFDIAGTLVETLVDNKQRAGTYRVRWDAKNHSSGIYFYRLQAGGFTGTRKMTLLR